MYLLTVLLAVEVLLPPPNVIERALVSTECPVRDVGETRLAVVLAVGGPSATSAESYFSRHHDPEVRHRLETARRRSAPQRRDRMTALADARWRDYPYIDALWYDVEGRVYLNAGDHRVSRYDGYRGYVAQCKDDPNDTRMWSAYRKATRRMVVEMLLAGTDPAEIDAMLIAMHKRDLAMCTTRNVVWRSVPEVEKEVRGK